MYCCCTIIAPYSVCCYVGINVHDNYITAASSSSNKVLYCALNSIYQRLHLSHRTNVRMWRFAFRWLTACSAAGANARASLGHSPLRTPRCGFSFSQAVRGRPAFIHKVTGLLESTTAPWKRRAHSRCTAHPRGTEGVGREVEICAVTRKWGCGTEQKLSRAEPSIHAVSVTVQWTWLSTV